MALEAERIRIQLRQFFRRKPVIKAEVFGLCARSDFDPQYGIELLVVLAPGTTRHDLLEMESELSLLLGRSVSLLRRSSVEEMVVQPARDLILNSAMIIYDAEKEVVESRALVTSASSAPLPPPDRSGTSETRR